MEWLNKILDTGLGVAAAKYGSPKAAPVVAQAAPQQASGMSQKTMMLIGGAIALVISLVVLLKK